MPAWFWDVTNGGVAPAVCGGAVWYVLSRAVPGAWGGRYAAAGAIAAGALLGYWLLGLGPWQAESHWEWLPYVLIGAAVVGGASLADGIGRVESAVLYALTAVVSGWFLVPTWEDLEPGRWEHLAVFVLYVVVMASWLEVASARIGGSVVSVVCAGVLIAAAGVLVESGNLRFGQMAGAGGSALVGIAITGAATKSENVLRGGGLAMAVWTAGTLLVGKVNSFSEVPTAAYLLVPVSVAGLVVGMAGPVARMTGWKRWLVVVGVCAVPAAVGVAMAVVAEMGGEGY